MKKRATVIETMTYVIEFDVPDGATEEEIENAARKEWASNPGRDPDDYECSIEEM